MLDRSKAPISDKIPTFSFPGYTKHTLSNGCNVIIIEDKNQPLITISLSIRLGAAHEVIPGLAKCTGSLLMSGTEHKTADQLSLESDTLGASIGVNSGWDSTEFTGFGLAEHIHNIVGMMSDCFFNAVFPETEVQKKKELLIADCDFLSVDPDYLATRACTSILFEHHNYGHARNGTTSTIASITREDCIAWHNNLLNGASPFFTVSGNCSSDHIISLLEDSFGAWNPSISALQLHSPVYKKGIHCVYTPKEDAVQTALHIAFPSIGIYHPDYTLFQIASTVYGGYFASRINLLLREQYGYTYGAYSYTDSRLYSSTYNIQTGLGNDATKHSIELLLAELKTFHEQPISKEEFSIASQYLLGTMVQGMETAQQISGRARTIEFYGLDEDYFTKKFEVLSQANADKVYAMQQQYFNPDHIVIAASGDRELLQTILPDFGHTTLFEEV